MKAALPGGSLGYNFGFPLEQFWVASIWLKALSYLWFFSLPSEIMGVAGEELRWCKPLAKEKRRCGSCKFVTGLMKRGCSDDAALTSSQVHPTHPPQNLRGVASVWLKALSYLWFFSLPLQIMEVAGEELRWWKPLAKEKRRCGSYIYIYIYICIHTRIYSQQQGLLGFNL